MTKQARLRAIILSAAAGIVVLGAVAGFMLLSGGGDEPASPGPTPTAAATVSATASATPVPVPTELTEIEGVPVQQLRMGEPAWPDDLLVIIADGCWGCDGPTSALVRMYRDADGDIIRDTLFEAPTGGEAYILHHDLSADLQRMLVTVCSNSYCGGLGEAESDAEITVFESLDGGITWGVLFTEAWVGWFDYAPTGGYHYYRFRNIGAYEGADLYTWPSMELVATVPPDGARPIVLADGSIIRPGDDGRSLVYDDHSPYFELTDGPVELSQASAISGGTELLLSMVQRTSGAAGTWYAGLVAGRDLQWTVAMGLDGFTLGERLGIAGVLDSSTLFGNHYNLLSPIPMLVDLNTGTVRHLDGPFVSLVDSPDALGGRNRLVGAAYGPFARVTNAGTCLNVRADPSPDAPILACHVDGVLLRERGQEQTIDGTTWVAVRTPGGREGWASAEFLER